MTGYIDNYGSAGNPVTDITGTILGLLLNFQPKGFVAPFDFSFAAFANQLSLPQALQTELATPLNKLFDQVWSQDTDASGQTTRDRALVSIRNAIVNATKQLGSNFSAEDIIVNLPATGTLRAIVLSGSLSSPDLSQIILLSYELPGVSAAFAAANQYTRQLQGIPFIPGALFPDPGLSVSFDIELLIQVGIPIVPNPFTLTASVNIENANIGATNWTASAGEAIKSALDFFTGQTDNAIQIAEGTIDSSGGQVPINVAPLSAFLTPLAAAREKAVFFGFSQLHAFINSSARTLNIRLTHPVDPAPVPVNAAVPTYPSLSQPILAASATQAQAGSSVTITGTNFPIAQARSLYIGWQDTTSGTVTESDIMWGPAGGLLQPVTKTRNGSDGGNTLTLTNLIPNVTYVFQVRDQDILTETPFTNPPTSITTQATDTVEIVLRYGGTKWVVGTANLSATGGFTQAVYLPQPPLDPGVYTLAAEFMGIVLATTTIQIVTTVQPHIEVIDPVTNDVTTGVMETYSFTLRGGGFEGGTISIYIDTAGGTSLGTSIETSTGSFTSAFIWPAGVIGTHDIVAQEIVGAADLEASVTISASALPT
jgi:hypothetical protein